MEDIVDISLRRDILFCINRDDEGLAELLSTVEENASTIATLQMMMMQRLRVVIMKVV